MRHSHKIYYYLKTPEVRSEGDSKELEKNNPLS